MCRPSTGRSCADACARSLGCRTSYFVFLTILSQSSTPCSAMRSGADDYLTKPLDIGDLEKWPDRRRERVTSLQAPHRHPRRAELQRLNVDLASGRSHRCSSPAWAIGCASREHLQQLRDLIRSATAPTTAWPCATSTTSRRTRPPLRTRRGDDVLRSIGTAVMRACRTTDLAFRYGGEEIAILLARSTSRRRQSPSSGLRAAVQALAIPHAGNDSVGVCHARSAGVAPLGPGAGEDLEEMLLMAGRCTLRCQAARSKPRG